MSTVTLRDIHKTYTNVEVVKGIDLEIVTTQAAVGVIAGYQKTGQ